MSLNRESIQKQLVDRALQDDEFKSTLLSDPTSVIEEEFGVSVPEGVDVKVVEETGGTQYIVIPFHSSETTELSDSELDAVEGGVCWNTCENVSCGVSSC